MNVKRNRDKLKERLKDNTLALIYSGREVMQDRENTYPFKVDSNYFYLTGLTEPDGLLAIFKDENGEVHETLFIPEIDPVRTLWVGSGYTKDSAKEISGIDEVYYNSEIEEILNPSDSTIYYPKSQPKNQRFKLKETLKKKYKDTEDLSPLLDEIRLIKSEDEISLIKKAGRLTGEALEKVAAKVRPGVNERELEALFRYELSKLGVSDLAFDTIAASGENALNLHYTKNNSELKDGDLILFDLGASFNGYSGDVSRTYPVNGKFDEIQKRFYSAVLNAQKRLIPHYIAGEKLKRLQELTKEYLSEELENHGIDLPEGGIDMWYYHGIGHSLGIDTHDSVNRDLTLEDGMVITCEPGLYAREYGIGIRIEDDILINGDNPVVLTAEIPKEINEIER